jgi:hypothetical protein
MREPARDVAARRGESVDRRVGRSANGGVGDGRPDAQPLARLAVGEPVGTSIRE